MTLFWIIYVSGAILTYLLALLFSLKKWDRITVSDLAMAIIIGGSSWVGLIIFCFVCGEDIIIYRRKKEEV